MGGNKSRFLDEWGSVVAPGVRVEALEGRYKGETGVVRSAFDVHKREVGFTIKLDRTQELIGLALHQLRVLTPEDSVPALPGEEGEGPVPRAKSALDTPKTRYVVVVPAGIVVTNSMNVLSKTIGTLPKDTQLMVSDALEDNNRARIMEPMEGWCSIKSPTGDYLIIKESEMIYLRDLQELGITDLKKIALREGIDVRQCVSNTQYKDAVVAKRRADKADRLKHNLAREQDKAEHIAQQHEEELDSIHNAKELAIAEERFEDAKKLKKKLKTARVKFAPEIERAKSVIDDLRSEVDAHESEGGRKRRKKKVNWGVMSVMSSDATSIGESVMDDIMDPERLEATLDGFPEDPRTWDLGTVRRWILSLDPMGSLDRTASKLHDARVTGDILITLDREVMKRTYEVHKGSRRQLNRACKALRENIQAWDQRGLVVADEWAEAELRRIFDKVDSGAGLLDYEGFKAAIDIIGVRWDEEQCRANYNLIDVDGGGEISYEEWVENLRSDDPDMRELMSYLTIEIMVGHKVEARWRESRSYDMETHMSWYKATVTRVNDDKTFQLVYEDGNIWHRCPIDRMRPVQVAGMHELRSRVKERLCHQRGIETREEEEQLIPMINRLFEKATPNAIGRLLSSGYEVKFDKEINKIRRALEHEDIAVAG